MDNEIKQVNNQGDVFAQLDPKTLKNMVTPDAFIVDENLYGLTLARPWRRAGAILLDLLLIAILTNQNVLFLAVVAAATFIRVGKDYAGVTRWRRTRRVLRFMSMILLAVVIYQIVSPTYDEYVAPIVSQEASQEASNETGSKSSQEASDEDIQEDRQYYQSQQASTAQAQDEDAATQQADDNSNPTSLTDWVAGFITTDLGFGFGWAAFYFSVFTAWWQGQTPGKRLFGIRVIQLDGTPLSLWSSFGRYGGYGAGFATGLLGFAQVLWDPNRQAIQDKISSTVVVGAALERTDDVDVKK